MHAASYAGAELAALLGADATDDTLYEDVRRFIGATLPIAAELWPLDGPTDADFAGLRHPRSHANRAELLQRCALVAERLAAEIGTADAARCAAGTLLHPQLWAPSAYGAHGWHYQRQAFAGLINGVAREVLSRYQPHDWMRRLAGRLYDLCTLPDAVDQSSFAMCFDYVLSSAAVDAPGVSALLDALTGGDWAAAWREICALAERPAELPAPALRASWVLLLPAPLDADALPAPTKRLRDYWVTPGAKYAVLLLARAAVRRCALPNEAACDEVDMTLFRHLLVAAPESLRLINAFLGGAEPEAGGRPEWLERIRQTRFVEQLRRLEATVLWELVCDLRPETWPVLLRVGSLRGGRYLLRLAEEVELRGLRRLPTPHGYWYGNLSVESALAEMIGRVCRAADDDSAALVPLLQQLQVDTLLAILPLARAFEAEICSALGWDGGLELIQLLRRVEADDPAHATDPTAGVLQREHVVATVARLGDEHARILLGAFARHAPGATLLVGAALGWNRVEVRRMFGRRKPLAVRALALLPFEKSDTLLRRYQSLTAFEREANASAAGKKAAERAAAQSALTALALNSGYADATRLEWAMQAQLGAQGVSLGRQWEIESYGLTAVLRNGAPALEIRNGARLLKRTPSVVTRDYAYREVRATLDQLRDQQRRFGQALVNAMRRGEPLAPAELDLLRGNPLATALLERLVLRTADGVFGLYRAEDHALEGYREERVRIDGPVFVAHPYDLAGAQILGNWQTEIVRRQLVQPFKQVFRELYVLTPAEAAAVYSSGRFAGRRIKGRQSAAVLANLGWQISGYGDTTRPFYEHGLQATFESNGYWYGGDDDDGATTGALFFTPLPGRAEQFAGLEQWTKRIRLVDIPPLVLSEVLRDLDLVTVVAHGTDDESSREVLERRADLVRATAGALGLGSVEVTLPHVRVQGSRAAYRVHLATAAIHIESGAYLCIVPAAKSRKATYLPFEEGGDPISSELISKVLLLANDRSITNPTILAQLAH